MKFWHWIVLIVVMFAVIYLYNNKVLGRLPVVGRYVSA